MPNSPFPTGLRSVPSYRRYCGVLRNAVASGELDAAVVDSIVRTTRARTDDAVANLEVIERLGPWPTQPLVARITLDADTTRTVRDRLLEAARGKTLRTELQAAGLAELVEAGPDHYQPVREAMARTEIGAIRLG